METSIWKLPNLQVFDSVEIHIDTHCLGFTWAHYLFIYLCITWLFGGGGMGGPRSDLVHSTYTWHTRTVVRRCETHE